MSTKELYEAHALIRDDKYDQNAVTYSNLVDDAIEKYIQAEEYLRIQLKGAGQRADGCMPDDSRMDQIYRERFKTVICRLAAQRIVASVIPDMTEPQALKYLADMSGCPRAVWQ